MMNTKVIPSIHLSNSTYYHHASKDENMLILHAIKLYKTDLSTSPLYCCLSRRVNGVKRWSMDYLVVTYAGFYF